MEIEKREQALQERLEKLHAMEQEILEKEKNLKEKEKAKKQVQSRARCLGVIFLMNENMAGGLLCTGR